MFEWWGTLSILQKVFAFFALPATLLLIVQTVMVIFGLGDDDADTDDGADMDGDGAADGFALFSIRGIIAFFAVGGWAGIVFGGTGMSPVLTIFLAFVVGTAALFGIALLFKTARKLQSAGNLLLGNAVGKNAKVYITIPGNGERTGKVTLTFQGRFSECDALTRAGRDLRPGEYVRISGLEDENTLIVEPLAAQTEKEKVEV